MKVPYTVSILFLSFLLSGCPLPPKVNSNYDSNFDFCHLKTYSWFQLPGDVEADEIVVQSIKNAVDRQMNIKGFMQDSESPDFLISVQGFKNTATQGAVRGTSYQRGTAGGTRRGTSGESMRGREFSQAGYNVVEYEEGTLTLTISNASTDQTVWEGIVTGLIRSNISTEAREQRTNETIARLLADFPPINK